VVDSCFGRSRRIVIFVCLVLSVVGVILELMDWSRLWLFVETICDYSGGVIWVSHTWVFLALLLQGWIGFLFCICVVDFFNGVVVVVAWISCFYRCYFCWMFSGG